MSNQLIYRYPVNIFDNNSTYGIAAQLIKAKSSVLDIGCFDGSFLETLKKQKKCVVEGIELNKNALKIAKAKGISAYALDLHQPEIVVNKISKRYDAITILDVIEHLLYPPQILQVLPKLLKDDGQLIVSIPNINHVDVIIKMITDGWETYDDGLLDRTHTHFYSSQEICSEFQKHQLYLQGEHHIIVPAGMTNIVKDHDKHMKVYESIRPLLNNDEAYTFQKVFVFTKSKMKSHTKNMDNVSLSRPSNYIMQRGKVFLKMLVSDLLGK